LKKPTKKIDDLSKEEKKKWEEKMRYLEGDTSNRNALDKIKQGRGWIF
jgi:hypothetical protein